MKKQETYKLLYLLGEKPFADLNLQFNVVPQPLRLGLDNSQIGLNSF